MVLSHLKVFSNTLYIKRPLNFQWYSVLTVNYVYSMSYFSIIQSSLVCDSRSTCQHHQHHQHHGVVYGDHEEMCPISSGQIFLCGMTEERPKLTSALISSRQDVIFVRSHHISRTSVRWGCSKGG